MTPRNPNPTAIETFLAPLTTLALKQPLIEGLVFWGDATGWADSPSEALESEEIAFYAEGLLLDGFHMRWLVTALAENPALPDHVRLYFWQDETAPPPSLPAGWVALDQGNWPA